MSKVSVDLGSIYIIMSYIQNHTVTFKEGKALQYCVSNVDTAFQVSSKTLTIVLEDKKVILLKSPDTKTQHVYPEIPSVFFWDRD